MMWVPNIAFLLLALSNICYGENPGAKFQITDRGLKKGLEYLLNNLMPNNSAYPLPDVTGSENVASEEMKYEFTNIRMVQFNLGMVSSQWVPETGVHVSMENGNATINCDWKLDSWLIKDSGSVVLTLSGLYISIILGIGRADPGVPTIYPLDCQAKVQDVGVDMIGGVSYIVDNIKKPIQDVVRKTVNTQLCSSIRDQVKKWDQSFTHLNLNMSFNNFIDLDLSLVGFPEISNHHANIGLKGLFRSRNKSDSETAFSPAPMTLSDQDGAMVYTGLSQASFNSLFSAYYSVGSLTLQVSRMVGNKEITTSDLAVYAPEISQHFPNSEPAKIHMSATRSPLVSLLENNMTIQFGGLLQANAFPGKTMAKNIFSVNIVGSIQADFFFIENEGEQGLNLTGYMELERIQIEGSQPAAEAEQVVVTENGVRQLFLEMVIPAANEKLSDGVFIPCTFLTNSTISFEKGFAILAADMV